MRSRGFFTSALNVDRSSPSIDGKLASGCELPSPGLPSSERPAPWMPKGANGRTAPSQRALSDFFFSGKKTKKTNTPSRTLRMPKIGLPGLPFSTDPQGAALSNCGERSSTWEKLLGTKLSGPQSCELGLRLRPWVKNQNYVFPVNINQSNH